MKKYFLIFTGRFDRLWKLEDKYFERTEKQHKEYGQKLVSVINPTKKDVMLDLGCGDGIITNYLARFCKKIVGIDLSQYAINKALKNKSPNAEFFVDDITSLKEVDKLKKVYPQFTKIIGVNIIHYIQKQKFLNLLNQCCSLVVNSGEIYFFLIPDIGRRKAYLNNLKGGGKIINELLLKIKGHDAIGYWYDKQFFKNYAENRNLEVQFFNEGYYRFGVKIKKIRRR